MRLKHLLLFVLMFLFVCSCQQFESRNISANAKDTLQVMPGDKGASQNSTEDSSHIIMEDNVEIDRDTTINKINRDSEITVSKVNRNPASIPREINRNPASIPVEDKTAKGYAIIYCPTKMITHVPSIVNATISKEEYAMAYAKFAEKIQTQNSGIKSENISRDIKGDSIDIYERMGVSLEFDPDDFKQISKNDPQAKSFVGKNTLEWQWILKPLHSTQKSIINFKFYYLDPGNKENYILEKTISISATVDARSFTDKWADFLSDDPKTTITVILVPLITFLGGFVSGRKKKSS